MTIRFERTTELPPGAGTIDWARIREGLARHKAAKGNYEVVADTDDDGNEIFVMQSLEVKSVSTLLEPAQEIQLKALPQAPRSIALRLAERGFEVHATQSLTSHTATLYVNDSKTTDAKAGDVRYPAHEATHYGLWAKYEHDGKVAIALRGFWDNVGGKNGLSGADILDPVNGRGFENKATALEEWVAVFAPKPPSKSKKKSAPTEPDLMNGDEWHE